MLLLGTLLICSGVLMLIDALPQGQVLDQYEAIDHAFLQLQHINGVVMGTVLGGCTC
jgi:hypothetical protein